MPLLPFWALNVVVALLSMEDQKALGFHQKYLNLCSEDERRSYGFGTTWEWVINDRIFIFGWTNSLNSHSDSFNYVPLYFTQSIFSWCSHGCHKKDDCCGLNGTKSVCGLTLTSLELALPLGTLGAWWLRADRQARMRWIAPISRAIRLNSSPSSVVRGVELNKDRSTWKGNVGRTLAEGDCRMWPWGRKIDGENVKKSLDEKTWFKQSKYNFHKLNQSTNTSSNQMTNQQSRLTEIHSGQPIQAQLNQSMKQPRNNPINASCRATAELCICL